MRAKSQSCWVCYVLRLFTWCCIVSIAHAEDLAVLPGIALSGVSFGTSEDAFSLLYPSAKKGVAGSNHQEYWVTEGSALYLVNFRSGKLALITASFKRMPDDEQHRQTSIIVEAMIKRFGSPKQVKTAKLLRRGVAEISALVFDLRTFQPNVKAVVESSELELAVSILDTNLQSLDRMFFSIEELLAEVNKGDKRPNSALDAKTVSDYIQSLALKIEADLPEAVTPTATPVIATPLPLVTPVTLPLAVPHTSPLTNERKVPTWLLLVVVVLALIVITALALKRRP